MKYLPTFLKHVFFVVISTFLGACVSTTPMLDTDVTSHWQFDGKIGIAYPDTHCNTDNCLARSDQGKIKWRQSLKTYHIELSDPFGRVLIRLDGNDDSLQAQTPGTPPIHADPQQFIALMVNESKQQSVFNALTPTLLRHWVTGRPAPNVAATIVGKQQFEQQGFHIISHQWRQTDIGYLPSLIIIEQGDIKLRLVIRNWQMIE